MTIAHEFEYVKPKSVGDAVKILSKYGSRAQVLAGGTDLVALISEDIATPDALVDIKGIDKLREITFKNGKLFVGALVTFNELRESPVIAKKFPVIKEMTGWVASSGIRNRATMVGNICSAVPCCDSGPILLVYDASVHVQGPRGKKRRVPINKWFVGPRKTVLKKGELVTGVTITPPKQKHAACFVKLRRYEGEDLAQASVTVMALTGNNYRVAFGSVGPVPMRGRKVEAALKGKKLDAALLEKVVALVPREISPITDIRSSKEYRGHMVGIMLRRGLQAVAERLAGRGPKYGVGRI